MHNLTTNNLLVRIISLFSTVPSTRDLKILSRDDNIGNVCMERPFRKVRRLQPRSFGHKCASVMIQLSKGYDQSKIPSRKGNFFRHDRDKLREKRKSIDMYTFSDNLI